MSLAGTAHSCTSCAGRSHPPFIFEVSTLAGCPGRHRRGFLKTCSQVSCFCCGSVMDRTGPLVSQHHLQIGVGHQTRKGREMVGGGRGFQNQRKAPRLLFTPGCLSVARLSLGVTQCCNMQWPRQTGDLKTSRVHLTESSYRNKDMILDLLVKPKILIGHRTISPSFRQEVIILLPTQRKKGGNRAYCLGCFHTRRNERSFCLYRN